MDSRHDAGRAAAGLMMVAGAIGDIRSGVATVGSVSFEPGAPTVIPSRAELVVDLRNADRRGAGRDAGSSCGERRSAAPTTTAAGSRRS